MSNEQNRQYKKSVKFDGKNYWIFDVKEASKDIGLDLEQLPFSLRVLFENVLFFFLHILHQLLHRFN
jgi:aconitase A